MVPPSKKIIELRSDNFLFKQHNSAVCSNNDFEIIKGDVRNLSLVKQLLKSADVIIPLAALVGAPICDADRQQPNL